MFFFVFFVFWGLYFCRFKELIPFNFGQASIAHVLQRLEFASECFCDFKSCAVFALDVFVDCTTALKCLHYSHCDDDALPFRHSGVIGCDALRALQGVLNSRFTNEVAQILLHESRIVRGFNCQLDGVSAVADND